MRRVLLRLSAHATIGLGHAVRLGGLIAKLRALGLIGHLSVVGEGDLWRPFIPDADHIAIKDGDVPSVEEHYDLIIHDYPFDDHEAWAFYRSLTPLLVAIDDWGRGYGADLIFNGTVIEKYHQYADLSPHSKVFCGADYTLLRPEFAEKKWLGPDSNTVSLIIGSGEMAARWALRLAQNWPDAVAAQMVVGGGFTELDALKDIISDKNIMLFQGLSGPDLADLICQSRLALCTGGMIAYEVVALHAPAIIFPQIDNLVDEIAFFDTHQACFDLGFSHDGEGGGMNMARLLALFWRLYDDEKALMRMSKAQSSLMDGRGVYRIAELISEAVTELEN